MSGWNLRIALARRAESPGRHRVPVDGDSGVLIQLRSPRACGASRRAQRSCRRFGEQAIMRQATLTADPVERTRLRLMLARLAEDRKDTQPRSKQSRPPTKKIRTSLVWCAPRWITTGVPVIANARSTRWKKRPRDRTPASNASSRWRRRARPPRRLIIVALGQLLDPLLTALNRSRATLSPPSPTRTAGLETIRLAGVLQRSAEACAYSGSAERVASRIDSGAHANEGLWRRRRRVHRDLE